MGAQNELSLQSQNLPSPCRIVDIRIENSAVRSFVLNRAMRLDAGQFVMAWLPGVNEKPFSPSAADPLTLTVTRVGPFTTAMHGLHVGNRIWLRGPFGRGFQITSPAYDAKASSGKGREGFLLIGGGCGAAPLLYLAQTARQSGQQVHVVLGARTAAGLFFQQQYAALGCHVYLSTDDGSAGAKGTSIECAESLLASFRQAETNCDAYVARSRLAGQTQDLPGNIAEPPLPDTNMACDTIYACGPEPMLDATYKLAQKYKLRCQLSYEAYMRCGIGVCGSCTCGGQLVCRDGPVFDRPPTIE